MSYVFVFCVFLAATLIAVSIAGAHEIRAEFDKIREEHEKTVRDLDRDWREKARELYMRHPIL